MDSARRLTDNEIISAEQLWEMDNPRAVAFVCPDCPVKLEPRACDKGQDWKVRPYFKRPTGAQHADGCNMEARDKLVAEAVKKPVLTRNPPPLPVYTRLDLAQENVRVHAPAQPRTEEFICGRGEYSGHEPTGPSTDRHDRTARTIRPICRQFVDFPQDRGIRLSLPGVAANTYADVFVPIRQVTRTGNFGRRLFYGEMRFRERVVEADGAVTIAFNTEKWHGPNTQFARVRIDTNRWGRLSVDELIRELHSLQEEARDKWKLTKQNGEERKRRKGEKGYVFFLGERDAEDPCLFHASDRRLVCGFLAEITEGLARHQWKWPPTRPFEGAASERSARVSTSSERPRSSMSGRANPHHFAEKNSSAPQPELAAENPATPDRPVAPNTTANALSESQPARVNKPTKTQGHFISWVLKRLFGK